MAERFLGPTIRQNMKTNQIRGSKGTDNLTVNNPKAFKNGSSLKLGQGKDSVTIGAYPRQASQDDQGNLNLNFGTKSKPHNLSFSPDTDRVNVPGKQYNYRPGKDGAIGSWQSRTSLLGPYNNVPQSSK